MTRPFLAALGKLSIVALAAIVALLILWNGTGEAQTPPATVAVSNAAEDHEVETIVGNNIWYAQSFCTGGTYTTLKQVSIFASDPYRMNPRVSLHGARIWGPGAPGNHLRNLTNPASFDSSYFTADDFTTTGYQLAPNTLYWIVARKVPSDSTGWFRLSGTNSEELDSGGLDGWKLGRTAGNWRELEAERLRITIKVENASLTNHLARFPRSCQAADYPSVKNTVVETAPANMLITTLTAVDADDDTLTYSISGQDAAAFNQVFTLNASTGEIRVKDGATLDYETRTRYTVRVDVSDGKDNSGNTESQATVDDSTHLTINIEDAITDNPFTAQSQYVPVCHAGEAFTFIVEFSEGPSINHLTLRDHAFTVTGGDVTGARRVEWGNNALWQIRVQPVSGDPVIVVLPETTDCGAEGAICTQDGRMLSSRLELTVFVPASQQIANAPASGVPGIDGIPLVGKTLIADTSGIADEDGLADTVFSYQWIRHDLQTATDMDIEGAAGRSYTVAPEDAGEALKVRVSFTDDWGNEESLTSYVVIASPSVIIPDGEEAAQLSATIQGAPESHDGQSAFTFELRFSEEVPVSGETLRDNAFTVTGGEVTSVEQLEQPGNLRWEVTVLPDSNGDVTVTLPATEDCDDQGAICTGDSRMLSVEVTLTVPGPSEEDSPPEPGLRLSDFDAGDGQEALAGALIRVGDRGQKNHEEQDRAWYAAETSAWHASGELQDGSLGWNDVTVNRVVYLPDTGALRFNEADPIHIGESFAAGGVNRELTIWVQTETGTASFRAKDHILSSGGGWINFRVPEADRSTLEAIAKDDLIIITVSKPTPPEAPTGLSAEASRESVSLTWTAPDDDSVAGYRILRMVRDADPPQELAVLVENTGSTATSYTDDTVSPSTKYRYQVRAVNEAGAGAGSATVDVATEEGFSLDNFDAGDGQEALAIALIRVGDRGRKNHEEQDRAWYAAETSAWHASGELQDGSLGWNDVTVNRVVYLPDTGALRFNEADPIHIGESFAAGGVNRELTIWVQTETGTASFRAKDHILSSGGGWINFRVPEADRSTLEAIAKDDLIVVAVSTPATS